MSLFNNAIIGAAGQQGYTISRSVRLRSSASAYLNRTLTTPTDGKKWTYSFWIKRGSLTTNQPVLTAYTDANNQATLYHTTGNKLYWLSTTGGTTYTQFRTDAVYRDPSAWYHFVVVFDSTNATSTDRIKMYVNGTSLTCEAGQYIAPALNTTAFVNTAIGHRIGNDQNLGIYLDGYLTEVNFIDGQALTPSSFGTTNALTGVWQPAKYTGTYGTNGFYLNFSDNSSNTATTIGKDYSGNGNNWTPNNISVTAGTTYDSMVDSPTVSAVSSNYAVWNQLQKTSTLSQANLLSAGGGSAIFYSVASTISIPSGKWYWEITCVSNTDGLTGIVETNQMIDVIRNGNYVGQTSLGYGYHANGKKYNNATSVTYGATYTTNDIIGVAFNADTGDLTFYKNGTSQGTAYTVSTAYTWLPADSVYASDSKAVNFGQRPFSYTPPTGFVALNTYNLPASTITNGAAYMAATIWTGDGTNPRTITNTVNGVSFQPDLVWTKARSQAYDHSLYDSVRGVTNYLISDSTAAEASAANTLQAFNSNGFQVGGNNYTNSSSATYVGWQWKAGGTSSSNTNGSITSTVSVGATQGFSVVTYTGTGSTATVGHGLGVAPSMIIIKNRSVGTDSWPVYHTSIGAAYRLFLNTTGAQVNDPTGFMNSTSPTSTVFTVGSNSSINNSGSAFVAYCFAAVKGFSAFGSYTANASADGPFIYTGFRPRWIMLKRSSAAGAPWSMFDTSRNTYNSTNLELDANASSAESTSGNGMDILSNGFKLRDSVYLNSSSGDTFIYAAFAESPFKNALAR